jgi:hypothetical protein
MGVRLHKVRSFKNQKSDNLMSSIESIQKNKTLLWVSSMCEVGHKYGSKIYKMQLRQFELSTIQKFHYYTLQKSNMTKRKLDVWTFMLCFLKIEIWSPLYLMSITQYSKDIEISQIQKWKIWETEFESNLWEVDWVQCRVTRGLA